jgi:hypothetical protein
MIIFLGIMDVTVPKNAFGADRWRARIFGLNRRRDESGSLIQPVESNLFVERVCRRGTPTTIDKGQVFIERIE